MLEKAGGYEPLAKIIPLPKPGQSRVSTSAASESGILS